MIGKISKAASGNQATEQRRPPRERLGLTEAEFKALGTVGAMYYKQGNLEKAYVIFAGLIEADPENSGAHAALGALLVRARRDEEALRYLNRALEIDGGQIAPYVNRAEVLLRQQKVEQAVVDLKRAIDLDPAETDPGANRARAIVLGIHQALQAQRGTVTN